FRLATLRIRIFECPHRLSDKLLKSSAASLFLSGAGVCIIRHPATESSDYYRFSPLTRRLVIRCSVSVEAHYRELFQADKLKIQKTYQAITFQPIVQFSPGF
ncbi:hypothetical protein, partial [Citrobacter europaeus]|uniref:hypothetical protein n=1 Tax=Citrobacter europaeus TaxID=1914243 RepID=UPI001BCCF10C